ncbi:MAG: glutathione S-transferase family protein [Symploca sp. SIO2B6]|nr:glutathione S-transferase family protein [Symploca sp. SIO2B6]
MAQLAPRDSAGAYIRPPSQFRQWIRASDNTTVVADSTLPRYEAEGDRYRLYVGMGCPWAHRTLVVRAIKELTDIIPITVVVPSVDEGGWVFEKPEQGYRTLKDLYQHAQPGYSGRSTVPLLWDSKTQTIVNNESADIIVMLNEAFEAVNRPKRHQAENVQGSSNQLKQGNSPNDPPNNSPDRSQNSPFVSSINLYPDDLKPRIDRWNEKIYHAVNNGVYRCGFAQTQAAYDQACDELFTALDDIDATLANQRYLCGSTLTLADIRLFTTLFRFDIVYYGLFKCNRRRIQDYPNLNLYLRDIYQLPGVADTCDLEAIKRDYYGNLFPLNPGQIIPSGPDITNLLEPHHRETL